MKKIISVIVFSFLVACGYQKANSETYKKRCEFVRNNPKCNYAKDYDIITETNLDAWYCGWITFKFPAEVKCVP